MNQLTLFPKQSVCPTCSHTQFKVINRDLQRCSRCGWLVRISGDGTARDALDVSKANGSRRP